MRHGRKRVTIGKIVGVHGVGGTMLILLTDHPERFFSMKKLTLKNRAYRAGLSVSKYHEGKDTFSFKCQGNNRQDRC